jgi:hypothetical protein
MSVRIRPGKVTCAGLVGILLVLPSSIWQDPDAEVRTVSIRKKTERNVDSARQHQSSGLDTTKPSM